MLDNDSHFSFPPPLSLSHPHTPSLSVRVCEGKLAQRAPGLLGIQINVSAIYPNALPQNMAPSSSQGTLSTNDATKHNCG